MEEKPRMLFWLNGFFLHYSLSYYLQSRLDADFFGIVDINTKPKKFLQNQNLVNFEKLWFFHDNIKKNQKPDLDYLRTFEKKYGLNLWKYALNERFFYLHNRFYKFQKIEILSILEQEIKLFELILDEIKPDYFLTYDPVFHHQKLLLDLCRKKGIKVLSTIIATGIKNKTIIVEDGATYDLTSNIILEKSVKGEKSNIENKESYDKIHHSYIQSRNTNFSNKLIALKNYLLDFDSELINSNFMYYGKSKLKVVKDALTFELRRRINYQDLQKVSNSLPDLNLPYVYFPMSIDEEMNTLHYAPYYTNQIEVIRNIAQSIPINYVLYVKEHVAAGIRKWHDMDYYNQIIDIPNVILINPLVDNDLLVKNSKLVITTRGYSTLKALKHCIPSIVFGKQPAQIMPSIFHVDSLTSLPNLIKDALRHKVDSTEYQKYEDLLDDRLFEFNMFEYEIRRDTSLYSGNILSNTDISNNGMTNFLDLNKDMFENMVSAHLKIINKI
jgi:hypothetical protein